MLNTVEQVSLYVDQPGDYTIFIYAKSFPYTDYQNVSLALTYPNDALTSAFVSGPVDATGTIPQFYSVTPSPTLQPGAAPLSDSFINTTFAKYKLGFKESLGPVFTTRNMVHIGDVTAKGKLRRIGKYTITAVRAAVRAHQYYLLCIG